MAIEKNEMPIRMAISAITIVIFKIFVCIYMFSQVIFYKLISL